MSKKGQLKQNWNWFRW